MSGLNRNAKRWCSPITLGLALTLAWGWTNPAWALCSGGSPQAIPSCNYSISAGYSYIVTPGCEFGGCRSNSSVTDSLIGLFWGLGTGDPRPGWGGDNGTFPALDGWLNIYPNYPAYLQTSWGADSRIDGCNFFLFTELRCMAVLLTDRPPGEGGSAFAIVTDQFGGLSGFELEQPGDINLARVPTPIITASRSQGICRDSVVACTSDLDCHAGTPCDLSAGVQVSFLMPPASTLEGNYLDPACGTADDVILGYRILQQRVPRNSMPPNDPSIGNWTTLTETARLGEALEAVVECPEKGDEQAVYVAAALVFDSGFESAYVSSSATRIECGPNLVDFDAARQRKPRLRERARSRRPHRRN